MRPPRIVELGLPHHVILRGDERRALFDGPRDHRRFLGHLVGASQGRPVDLHHVCLLSDRIELVATPHEPGALSGWVRDFAQPYAHHRNRSSRVSGSLFGRRFRSAAITDDGALIACTARVELGPVTSGLVRRAEEYAWSTTRLLIGDLAGSCISMRAWTPTRFYLGLGATPGRRAAEFGAWLAGLARAADARAGEMSSSSRADRCTSAR